MPPNHKVWGAYDEHIIARIQDSPRESPYLDISMLAMLVGKLHERVKVLENQPGAKALCSRCGRRFDECTCYADLQARVDEFVKWARSAYMEQKPLNNEARIMVRTAEACLFKLRQLGLVKEGDDE